MRFSRFRFRSILFTLLAAFCVAGAAPAMAQLIPGQTGTNQEEEQQQGESQSGSPGFSTPQSNIYGATSIQEVSNDESTQLQRFLEAQEDLLDQSKRLTEPPEPGEFEKYVERVIGRPLPRYGADLLLPESRNFAAPATATVPPDYRLNVGDVVSISLAGSVEGSTERTIDANGNIFLPAVGQIHLAGVRSGDLGDVLDRAIGTQYRNFRYGVRVAELRGIRVYVTGFARSPGAFSVGSLSTVANAILQAGGPNPNGSMRSVKLIRNGQEVADFDLYELLLGGSRVNDAVLQNEDVLFIPPAGPQVAVFGSVTAEAIYELRGTESLADVLAIAGGTTQLGDAERLVLYRVADGARPGPMEVVIRDAATMKARPADIIQVLSEKNLVQPTASQRVFVKIEGEVEKPGNYYVEPGASLSSVIALAGGMTSRAFPFGTELNRNSVAAQQRKNFDDAIDQFEMTLASAPLTADSSISADRLAAQNEGARLFLEKMREAEPDGRLVLEIEPTATSLPDLPLENGDRVYVPPVPSSVGVFGAVYRPASYMIADDPKKVKEYLSQAGGPVRAADKRRLFVVRANGEVLPRSSGAMGEEALPGDVIFVPVKTSSKDLLTKIGQISSIIFQFGIAAATVAAID